VVFDVYVALAKAVFDPTEAGFINAALDAIFYRPFGIGGIPLSTSITSFVTFMLLLHFLSKRTGGLDLMFVLDGFLKSLAAAAFAGVLAWSTWYVLDGWLGESFVAQVISVGMGGVATVAAFLAAAQALNMPEIAAGRSLLSARRGVR
jgi:peptidoglycan biosynthesis protein MviN/MurJ (putative lipid II flippase)